MCDFLSSKHENVFSDAGLLTIPKKACYEYPWRWLKETSERKLDFWKSSFKKWSRFGVETSKFFNLRYLGASLNMKSLIADQIVASWVAFSLSTMTH